MLTAVSTRGRALTLAAAIGIALACGGTVVAQDATPMPYLPGAELDALSGSIESDGSSTVGPITEAVAEEFAAVAPGVQVTVNISGTGGGFERFCTGETDVQNASRPIKEDEMRACADAGVDYYEFEVAYDGLSIVVNPSNDFVDCLTVDQLAQLWAPKSTVTTWADLNPAWPDDEIGLYGPGPDSGTFDYFTDVIVGEEGASRTDYTPSEDDNVLVEGVAGDDNALGYFGFAYYEQNADRLKLVQVDGGRGCVEPSTDSIRDGSYAPLSRPIYIYVKAESLERPEVQEFTRFYLAHAGSLAADVGYVASPDATYVADQQKLDGAIAGAVQPDGPVVAGATPES